MSVPTEQRSLSPTQFLDTAEELAIFSMEKCKKFPKRYSREITEDIRKAAVSVMTNTKRGNSVYVKTQRDAELRRRYMMQTYCDCEALVSLVKLAHGLFPLCGYLNRDEDGNRLKKDLSEDEKKELQRREAAKSAKILQQWSAVLYEELELIRKQLNSEWERYKNIK